MKLSFTVYATPPPPPPPQKKQKEKQQQHIEISILHILHILMFIIIKFYVNVSFHIILLLCVVQNYFFFILSRV